MSNEWDPPEQERSGFILIDVEPPRPVYRSLKAVALSVVVWGLAIYGLVTFTRLVI